MASCSSSGIQTTVPTAVPRDALSAANSIVGSAISMANIALGNATGLMNAIAGIVNGITLGVETVSVAAVSSNIFANLPTPPIAPDMGDIGDPPTVIYDYNESLYTSALGDKLNEVLLYELTNGSTGLTAAVEDAIYDRESERDLQELYDTKTRIAANWAETNSPLPDSVLYANMAWADLKYQVAKSDKDRDVRIESFKRADDNARFVKDLTMKVENTIRDYTSKYWDRQLQKAKDVLTYAYTAYELLIKWKLGLVELYKGESQAYAAQAQGIAAIAGVEVEEFKGRVQLAIGQADVDVKVLEVGIQQLNGKVQASVAAISGISHAASTYVAGALSAIHAGATIGFDGREELGGHTQVSRSCQDQYNHTDPTE